MEKGQSIRRKLLGELCYRGLSRELIGTIGQFEWLYLATAERRALGYLCKITYFSVRQRTDPSFQMQDDISNSKPNKGGSNITLTTIVNFN